MTPIQNPIPVLTVMDQVRVPMTEVLAANVKEEERFMRAICKYICLSVVIAVTTLKIQSNYYIQRYNSLEAQTKAAQENYGILQKRLYINDFDKTEKRSMKYMTIHKYKGGQG
jgi:hypothetical protein